MLNIVYDNSMEITDSKSSVSKSAFHFLTGTFMSRLTGMIRDLLMAFCFGVNPAVGSFLIAFRLSNLLRRLFGEGALLNGFIPFFEAKRKESGKEGAEFFRDLFWSLALILFGVVTFLELAIMPLYFFANLSESVKEIVYMLSIQLPGLLFICLFGLSMALLQCEKNYFIPGVAPVAFNLIWIAAVWNYRNYPVAIAMNKLSIAVVLAFFLQWITTTFAVKKYASSFLSFKSFFTPVLFAKELKLMVMPILYGVFGVAAVQINSAVDIIFAKFASSEGPAILSYGHRVQQLPVALFAIAISSALMPPLARAIKNGNYDDYRSLLRYGIAKIYAILFPGMVAIFTVGLCSINLLYGRGEFTSEAVVSTTICLWCYGIGILPVSMILLIAPAYYARRDYQTPMKASLIAVCCNILLNTAFISIFKLPVCFVALATSLTAFLNVWYLSRRLQIDLLHKLMSDFVKVGSISIVSGVVATVSGIYLFNDPSLFLLTINGIELARDISSQIIHFSSLTGIFGICFFVLAYIFNVEQALSLLSSFRPRKNL